MAALAWLAGFWFLVWCYRSTAAQPEQTVNELGESDPAAKDWLRGSVEIEAPIHGLADKLAQVLVKISSGSLSVSERTQDRLSFQRVGPAVGGLPERGEIQFSSLNNNRTQAEYAVQVRGYRGLLWGGAICQALGLVALVVGGWAVHTYAVQSQDPEVRAQSLQMLQIAHFLWPPFLFAGLYRARRRMQANQMWFLLRSLPQAEV
ncbi:MAG TPA: hypothetical protein VKS79_17540 [Gemmataceae bacterium]|nr:hypothetical protein [Gemmataceae bacterium]